jgi:hypothetical protein
VSNNDSFIDEVTDEVRRDKLFAMFRKYGWIGVLGVLAIVGGAAFNEYRKATAQAKAEGFGDAVLAAMANDDPAARAEALAKIGGTGGQAAVLSLLAGAEALAAEDRDAAAADLRKVAEDAGQPEIYRQLAMLKLVILSGDKMDAAERDQALAGLAEAGKPFRMLAMEQQALALVAEKKVPEAVTLLRAVLQEPGLTAALRRRATQLIVALGEDPEAA